MDDEVKEESRAEEVKEPEVSEETEAPVPASVSVEENPGEEEKKEEEDQAASVPNVDTLGNPVDFIVIEDEPTAEEISLLTAQPYYDEKAFMKHKGKKKVWKFLLVAIVLILLIGYGVMTALSYRYYQANTIINGVDYSFRTVDEAKMDFDERVAGYQIHITLRNGELWIQPSDIGLVITTEQDVQRIKDKQNPFLWFMGFYQKEQEATYKITYDESKLREYIGRQKYFQESYMIAPTNPVVEMQSAKPVIIPGVKGTTLDVEKVFGLLDQMIYRMDTELDVEAEGCYIEAEYDENSERVVEFRRKLEAYTRLMLIYQYADINIQVKANDIYDMLMVDQEKYYCAVSRAKVAEYIDRFAEEHDTYGKERLFKTHDGKMVRLTNNLDFGWEIDREKETNALYSAICGTKSFIRPPVFAHEAYAYSVDGSDIGRTYVEVDLTNQRAYFYVDGVLMIQGDVISGRPSRGADTPGGFYTLYGGWKNVVLRGPGYASPVKYWMPFNGGIGLHDASWQSEFGGDLFLTRGSHGCVNLQLEMAETVYKYCYKGMSVVCYWRNTKYMVDPKDAFDTRVQEFYSL